MGSKKGGALVVGAGLMGRWHASNLRRLNVPVSGIVDPVRERALGVARAGGGAPTFSSLHEALAQGPHISAHVCTPLSSHVELVSALLDSGVHVVVEKPVATSYAETATLVDKASAAGLMLCPVHQFLFETGFLRLMDEVRTTGPIRHIDMVASSAGAAAGGPETAEEVMADILPHPLSLMRRILGPAVGEAEWLAAGDRPGELRASATCAGATLGILISMAGRPTRNTLRVMGENGTTHVDLFHGFAVTEPPSATRVRKISRPLTLATRSLATATFNLAARGARGEPAYPGLRELLRRYYSAIDGGAPPPIEHQETLDVARARDQILSLRA